jgi:hypothetical protein
MDFVALFFRDAFQLHVLAIKSEAARVGDMHRFHRHDNIVADKLEGTGSRIALTVLPGELRGVSVDHASASCVRSGAVAIAVGRIECNLERVTALMDAEFKHTTHSKISCPRIRRRIYPLPRPSPLRSWPGRLLRREMDTFS